MQLNLIFVQGKYHRLIVESFRNCRKRLDRNRIREPCRKKSRIEILAKDYYGLANFSPKIPDGDTIDTLNVLKDWLLNHFKVNPQNGNQVNNLMAKTFYLRRCMVINMDKVNSILYMFPYLRKHEHVSIY